MAQFRAHLHDLPDELCDNIAHALRRAHLIDASSLHFLVHLHGLSVLDVRLLSLSFLQNLLLFSRDIVSIRAEDFTASARQWRSLTTMKLMNFRFLI